MKTTFLKELPLLMIVAAPLIYLWYVWSELPEQIPMHYDLQGEIDSYGSRMNLVWMTFLLPGVMYLLMLLIPRFDPKGKIEKMGTKYRQLKFLVVIFMSALATCFIYFSAMGGSAPPNGPVALIGLFLAVMGNYFQSIRPNYFIGIRTPWTLENETVWRETHRMAGKIWLAGGLLVAIISLVVSPAIVMVVFISMVSVMAIVPIVYSYLRFRELKKVNQ